MPKRTPSKTDTPANAGAVRSGGKRQYTDAQKAEALTVLEANGGNVKGTARALGLPVKTLSDWAKNRGVNDGVAEIRPQKRADLLNRFMDEIHEALSLAQTKRSEATYKELITSAAILTDKHALLSGSATNRTELNVVVEYVDGGSNADD